jgi:copper transport protein
MRRKATTLGLVIAAILLAALTFLYKTWIHVESPSALVGTAYGFVLWVKVAISGVMIVPGGVNAFVLPPRLFAESDAGERRLFNSVRFEMSLAMIVLLLAAILAFLPPAREHKPISASEAPTVQEAR